MYNKISPSIPGSCGEGGVGVVSRPETSQSSGFHFGGVEVGPKPKSSEVNEKSDCKQYHQGIVKVNSCQK